MKRLTMCGVGDVMAMAAGSGASATPGVGLVAPRGPCGRTDHVARLVAPRRVAESGPCVIVVDPSEPARTLEELVAFNKAPSPQTAGAGRGGVARPGAELLARLTGIEQEERLGRGSGPASTDLLGGRVPMAVTGLGSAEPCVDARWLRGVPVSGAEPSPSLPDVATPAQAGLPGVEASIDRGSARAIRKIASRVGTHRQGDGRRAQRASVGRSPR